MLLQLHDAHMMYPCPSSAERSIRLRQPVDFLFHCRRDVYADHSVLVRRVLYYYFGPGKKYGLLIILSDSVWYWIWIGILIDQAIFFLASIMETPSYQMRPLLILDI